MPRPSLLPMFCITIVNAAPVPLFYGLPLMPPAGLSREHVGLLLIPNVYGQYSSKVSGDFNDGFPLSQNSGNIVDRKDDGDNLGEYTDAEVVENAMLIRTNILKDRLHMRNRFSLGAIIMGIPWLPLEVNVPDTISWMYSGIAGIISGIGQRFPRPNRPKPPPAATQELDQPSSKIAEELNLRPISMPAVPVVLVPTDFRRFINYIR